MVLPLDSSSSTLTLGSSSVGGTGGGLRLRAGKGALAVVGSGLTFSLSDSSTTPSPSSSSGERGTGTGEEGSFHLDVTSFEFRSQGSSGGGGNTLSPAASPHLSARQPLVYARLQDILSRYQYWVKLQMSFGGTIPPVFCAIFDADSLKSYGSMFTFLFKVCGTVLRLTHSFTCLSRSLSQPFYLSLSLSRCRSISLSVSVSVSVSLHRSLCLSLSRCLCLGVSLSLSLSAGQVRLVMYTLERLSLQRRQPLQTGFRSSSSAVSSSSSSPTTTAAASRQTKAGRMRAAETEVKMGQQGSGQGSVGVSGCGVVWLPHRSPSRSLSLSLSL